MPEEKVNWDAAIWRQIKKADSQGLDIRIYAQSGYDQNILKQVRLGMLAGVDLKAYIKEGYDWEQLREIRVAVAHGIPLVDYLQQGFCGAQLRQIRKGLHSLVDVKMYTDISYNWLQMREIRLGLQNRVDASLYANPLYTYAQMQEIRLGLEMGLDVTSYARLILSCMDMREARKKLILQRKEEDGQLKDMVLVDEGTGLQITLTNNHLEAYITFPKEHRKLNLTLEYVEQILRRNGIVEGILPEEIQMALSEGRYNEPVLVAQGREPQTGEDGHYEFFFRTESSRRPVELPDGRVDYQNVDIFEEVKQGQVLAKYISATKGRCGLCVEGMEIAGKKGQELPMLRGQGISLWEDGVTYVAEQSGIIEYQKGEIQIFETLTIKEDVTSSYGNVQFHGCIRIMGNVGSNVRIQADGSISIEGTVEAANIICGADVLIKNGMAGAGKGNIEAQGNIAGKFFEACILHAGNNIEAGSLMNSEAEAEEKIVIMGRKGAVIGGRSHGVKGVEANYIGNRSQLMTIVATGASQGVLDDLQNCQTQYEQVQVELLDISTQMGQCSDKEKETVAYRKLLARQQQSRQRAKELQGQRKMLQQILLTYSEIKVLSRAYAGTQIVMNQIQRNLNEDCSMTVFCLENNVVVNK